MNNERKLDGKRMAKDGDQGKRTVDLGAIAVAGGRGDPLKGLNVARSKKRKCVH